MRKFTMRDVIPLISIPDPPADKRQYNVACPCCDHRREKHLNINLVKDVYRCPRCNFSGGVFDLYAFYTGINREDVRAELIKELGSDSGNGKRHNRRPPAKPKPEEPVITEYPATDVETRDKTYRALFRLLSLAPDHAENLRNRGLSDEAIRQFNFKSTPMVGHKAIAKKLMAEGHYLAGVPGFHRDDEGEWTLVEMKRGILTPVCDAHELYQGAQNRLDNAKRRKFRWVSSRGMTDGCGAEGWTHFVGPVREEILLVEGPMKADVIHHLTGQSLIAVPGVNSLLLLETMLEELKAQGVRKIMTCFDMDYLNNWYVQNGYWEMVNLLDSLGFSFGTYLWSPEYNGLDDFIWQFMMQQ